MTLVNYVSSLSGPSTNVRRQIVEASVVMPATSYIKRPRINYPSHPHSEPPTPAYLTTKQENGQPLLCESALQIPYVAVGEIVGLK